MAGAEKGRLQPCKKVSSRVWSEGTSRDCEGSWHMAAEKPETMHLSLSIPLLSPRATCSRYLRPPGGNLSPRPCPAQMGAPDR